MCSVYTRMFISHKHMRSSADVRTEVEVEPLNGTVHFILINLNTSNVFSITFPISHFRNSLYLCPL